MTEIFFLHLVRLNANAEPDASSSGCSDDVLPLVHVEVNVHNVKNSFSDGADAHGEVCQSPKSLALLSKLYYCAASIVSEVEEGRVTVGRHVSDVCSRKSPAYIRLENNSRLFIFSPVEDHDFILAITVPPAVWRFLGPVTVQVLLSTAVCGYEIATNVAAVASVPTYCPLHERLLENSDAVTDVVRMRLEQLAKLIAFLGDHDCQEPATSSIIAPPDGSRETAPATVFLRMIQERPSAIRAHNRLAFSMNQLLCAATHYSDYTALSGAVSSSGMQNGYKRLVLSSAAVWYHGVPLFSSATSEDFEAHLLPAAIVAYMRRFFSANPAQPLVSVKTVAMHAPAAHNILCAAGYIKLSEEHRENAASVCVTFISSGGWVVTLRLERALNVFTGAPMSQIVSGVTNIILRTFETPRFLAILREGSFEGHLLGTLQPSIISHTTVYALNIMRAVRHLGLFARYYGGGCTFSSRTITSRDFSLYRYSNTAAGFSVGDEWCLWPKYIENAVLHLLEVTSHLFCLHPNRNVCGRVHRSLPFSLLRGPGTVVVLLTAPVHRPDRKVVFFLAEMNSKDIPLVSELRAFAGWMLSKVL